jgi:glycosyltransferase involved in cell wall biosynthesis
VAVAEGGRASLIADGETGLLAPPPDQRAQRLVTLVNAAQPRERIRKSALLAVVGERTWEASLQRLATGYRSAMLRAPA